MAENLPQQPISHEIDRRAVRSFESKIPSSWNSNSPASDYGWDRLVTIPSSPGRVGDDFLVQIKGSESVNYLKESAEISHAIEVTTLNWLQSKLVPVMFAVCDVAKDEQPVFWTWISDAIDALEKDNQNWTSQSTVKIRIPVANRLSPETHSLIEQHVKDWHQTQRFNKEIAYALRSDRDAPTSIAATKSESIFDIKQDVLSSLHKAGLADLSETDVGVQAEILDPEAAELLKRITEAGAHLDALHDNAARRILRDIESKIDSLPIGVRAKYANCAGVLALHDGQDALSLAKFREALTLRPQETKYAGNVLTVESKISHDTNGELPTDWDQRLNSVLDSNPKAAGAIRLKTARLAELSSLDAAEKYIRSSDLWAKQKGNALIALADVARDRGAVDHALDLISEAEAHEAGEPDITLLAIKANLLLRKAVPDSGVGKQSTIPGFGPSDLDISKLQRSRQAYEIVLTRFAQCGYPRVAEQSFLNAVTVSVLLGDNDGAAGIARRFLEFYPDSGLLNGALALALFHKGDNISAVPHAEIAFNQDPDFSQNYIRLANILMAADDHDGFLQLANQRQNKGFCNEREENITSPHNSWFLEIV